MATSQSKDDNEARILRLLREVMPWQLAKKEIRPEMTLQSDLGIDSMGRAAFVFRIEEEFNLSFEDFADKVGDVRTVQDVLNLAGEILARAHEERSETA